MFGLAILEFCQFILEMPWIMDVLYLPSHRQCENYESDKKPTVEIIQDVESFEKNSTCSFIVYILSGTLSLSCGTVQNHTLSEGDLMLFPPGVTIAGKPKKTVRTLLLRINDRVSLCDKYTVESLYLEQGTDRLTHTHLNGNRRIRTYMEDLADNLAGGLRCVRFLTVKTQELFYYLRAYYSKEELAGFYLPLMGFDARFLNFIWSNYRQANNVVQFARMANQSLTKFKTKFKQITGMSPGMWLAEQKARNILHDLHCGQKSQKDLCVEYGFSSPSHLGVFCRKKFGKSPGRLKPGKIQIEEYGRT